MDISLKGKHAIICGASRGIGRATAVELAKNGASVTLVARSSDGLEKVKASLDVAQGQKHHIVTADFNDPIALAGLSSAIALVVTYGR